MINTINAVTVFLSGASVTRTVTTDIQVGSCMLQLADLPRTADLTSIVVDCADCTLKSVDIRPSNSKKLSSDSIDSIKVKIKDAEQLQNDMNCEVAAHSAELKALKSLLKSKNDSTNNLESIKSYVDFAGAKTLEMNRNISEKNRMIAEISKEIEALHCELSKYFSEESYTNAIFIEYDSTIKKSAEFTITYLDTSAGWVPMYRLENLGNNKIEFEMVANVHQTSGENWENVTMTFSNANPQYNRNPPIFYPEYVDMSYLAPPMKHMSKRVQPVEHDLFMEEEVMYDAPVPAFSVSSDSSAMVMEYKLTTTASVMSGGQYKKSTIFREQLDCTYIHYIYPKYDTTCYMKARVNGLAGRQLLPASATIFNNKKLVERFHLDTSTDNEYMDISLGCDYSIVCKREQSKNFTAKTILGGNEKTTNQWDITVMNNKTGDINLSLVEQLPISLNKQISVEPIELSGASVNQNNGKVEWESKLKGGTNKKYVIKYSITRPTQVKL